jgi:hypothetical protein
MHLGYLQFILNIIDKELRTSSDIASATPSELTFEDQDGINVRYTRNAYRNCKT